MLRRYNKNKLWCFGNGWESDSCEYDKSYLLEFKWGF
jgi:hypothetical protein